MKNIFLVGFMGSGKSTVGKILSEKTGLKFIDIDEEIEKKQGKKIKDIFKEKGEKFFRNLEKEEIKNLAQKEGFIVSTGGGLGANPENMKIMKKNGIVVWIDVSLDEILRRCGNDMERPLLNQPYESLKNLYEERKKVYSQAHIHIQGENKVPEKIAEEILEKINGNFHRD
ncbi:MAG: shikimate kinase [Aquificae bacterium]|nr:shikimate kinase [Aquificota bacterium]